MTVNSTYLPSLNMRQNPINKWIAIQHAHRYPTQSWKISRAKLRPMLCQTKQQHCMCYPKCRCRHTLYFGKNKRSLFGNIHLTGFLLQLRISTRLQIQHTNKINGIFYDEQQIEGPQCTGRHFGFISTNFYTSDLRDESIEQWYLSLQCKRDGDNDFSP